MAETDPNVIPLTTREGVPVCPSCQELMEQVEDPSDRYPGGQWQCERGRDQMDEIARGLANALDRIRAKIVDR